jgi:hypothetical protein
MLTYQSREAVSSIPATTRRHSWYVAGYFAALLLLGLFIYKDYGVSWDESIDRINGLVNAKYILGQVAPDWTARQPIFADVPEFHGHDEIDHGVLFHLPLALLEVFSGGIDSRLYYLIRHFCTFLTFVLGAWALYRLTCIRFKSWRLGLLAATLLVLSPRIFADAFYNGKDLVFLSFFTVAIYTLVRLLQRPTLARAVLHGAATAAATDLRILGCLLFALSIGMLALEALLAATDKPSRLVLLKTTLAYCAAAVVFTIVGWPYLWSKPFQTFLEAFDKMQRFRWEGAVVYLGEIIPATTLPWHYAPVWIVISTPVAYTLAFCVGSLSYVGQLLRRGLAPLRTFEGRLDLLFSGWFIIPVLMVVVLHSVIYDGWRHLYFIYPAMLLLGVRGIQLLWELSQRHQLMRRVALVLAVGAGLEGLLTLGRMVASHPHEQVYYSFLPGSTAERLFDRDYWGLSYRKGLEWILTQDTGAKIAVSSSTHGILVNNNLAILAPADRARFVNGPARSNYYYLADYRAHPGPYPDSLGAETHVVRVNGVKILSVFHKW